MTLRRHSIGLLLIALLLGGTPLSAQQESQDADAAAEEQTQNEQQGAQTQDEEERQATGDDTEDAPRQSDDDTFRPSEEISEDLSVSFPVDI